MSIYEEKIEVLPERLETSDYNFSYFSAAQGNGAIQLAGGAAGQLALQRNTAGAIVTQINF